MSLGFNLDPLNCWAAAAAVAAADGAGRATRWWDTMITVVGQSENAGRHINIWMRNLKSDAALINDAQAFTGRICAQDAHLQACQSAAVERELKYCQHLKVPHMLKQNKIYLWHVFSPCIKMEPDLPQGLGTWVQIGSFTHPVKFTYK